MHLPAMHTADETREEGASHPTSWNLPAVVVAPPARQIRA